MFIRTAIVAAVLVAVAAEHVRTQTHADPFMEQLARLQQLRTPEVGREPIVTGYERLIRQYPDHPQVAEAMQDLASRYLNSVRELGIRPDHHAWLCWHERAIAAAQPGSSVWIDSSLNIVCSVDPERAHRILDDVQACAQGDNLVLVQAERARQDVFIKTGDLDDAEACCHRLANWYTDPTRTPGITRDKGYMDSYIRNALPAMIRAWEGASTTHSKEIRIQRLEALSQKYGMTGIGIGETIETLSQKAINRIQAQPEEPKPQPARPNLPNPPLADHNLRSRA